MEHVPCTLARVRSEQSAIFVSADDGTLCHKQTGISIGQKGLKDGHREFSIDPEDIEVSSNVFGIRNFYYRTRRPSNV